MCGWQSNLGVATRSLQHIIRGLSLAPTWGYATWHGAKRFLFRRPVLYPLSYGGGR